MISLTYICNSLGEGGRVLFLSVMHLCARADELFYFTSVLFESGKGSSTSVIKYVHVLDKQCPYANRYPVLQILLHVLSGEGKKLTLTTSTFFVISEKKNCVKYLDKFLLTTMRIEGSDNFGICSSVMKFFIILIICSGLFCCHH